MPRGGGSGGRGHKSGHKGQRRHFTSPEELEAMKEKEEREREWREKRGDESTDEEKDDEKNGSQSSDEEAGTVDENVKKKVKEGVVAGDSLEIDNPNRVVNKTKKVSQLDVNAEAKPELSRKEREEIERQKARANYQKLHAEGKTEEARSDLARLAIIKKQREEAAKKRDDEKRAKEAAKAAKTESLNKALGKGKKT